MHVQVNGIRPAKGPWTQAGWLMVGALLSFAECALAQQPSPSGEISSAQHAQIAFDIPAQALHSAVVGFAEQSGIQVIFDGSTLAGLQSQALKGRYSVQQAIALLLDGLPVSHRTPPPLTAGRCPSARRCTSHRLPTA
jgi:hypothetical protein